MGKINVIYEDNHLLAVEKPVNIPVQKDISNDMDLLSLLKQYVKEKYNKPGNVFLGLVHRLDRPVGGAMVFARTSKAASRLSEQIRTRKMQKTYLAVVVGIPSVNQGTYVNYLLKDKGKNLVKVVPQAVSGSKKAILHYTVIESNADVSLVKIRLETGRPHQIRVQFSHDGHPLLGDKKYGGFKMNNGYGEMALWSHQLVFKHPVRDEMMSVTSMPPEGYPWNLFSWMSGKQVLEGEK